VIEEVAKERMQCHSLDLQQPKKNRRDAIKKREQHNRRHKNRAVRLFPSVVVYIILLFFIVEIQERKTQCDHHQKKISVINNERKSA